MSISAADVLSASPLPPIAGPTRTAVPTISVDPANVPVVDPVPTGTDPVIDPAPPSGEELRGVLRNLASGHFRGVAELRLRANFADEIAAAGITLPDPAPAKGKGRAYERLMAQYQAANAPPPAVAEPAEGPSRLNAVA